MMCRWLNMFASSEDQNALRRLHALLSIHGKVHHVFSRTSRPTCIRTLELAGPAFMKWGQWAATRADMFPPDMCRALESLQSRAPAHPLRFTRDAIQRSLGAPIADLFDDFEDVPVASGSIGQVHRARLSAQGARSTGIDPGQRLPDLRCTCW